MSAGADLALASAGGVGATAEVETTGHGIPSPVPVVSLGENFWRGLMFSLLLALPLDVGLVLFGLWLAS